MADTDAEKQWRQELESAGETAVRDNVNYRGGIITGGEPKHKFVLRWLREKEQERQKRERESYRYLHLTLWIAAATLFVAIVGVIATVLHK
jgi:hypothetical protein